MTLEPNKLSIAHDDLNFIKTLYFTSIKDLLEMDNARLRNFINKTALVCNWLEGIQKLSIALEKQGR
jgi:hypothetical protein